MPEGTPEIQGYDLEKGRDLDGLMAAMLTSGFQATQLGRAVHLVNEMVRLVAGPVSTLLTGLCVPTWPMAAHFACHTPHVALLLPMAVCHTAPSCAKSGAARCRQCMHERWCTAPAPVHQLTRRRAQIRWRLSDDPVPEGCEAELADPAFRARARCKIFLGFTSNLISSGAREVFRYLCKHRMVDVVVTTAGAAPLPFILCTTLPAPRRSNASGNRGAVCTWRPARVKERGRRAGVLSGTCTAACGRGSGMRAWSSRHRERRAQAAWRRT